MRYALLRHQPGGCDYTIACGSAYTLLPRAIQTFEDALEYAEENHNIFTDGDRALDECIILEIGDVHRIDVNAGREAALKKQQEHQAVIDKEKRRQQFNELQKEFGNDSNSSSTD